MLLIRLVFQLEKLLQILNIVQKDSLISPKIVQRHHMFLCMSTLLYFLETNTTKQQIKELNYQQRNINHIHTWLIISNTVKHQILLSFIMIKFSINYCYVLRLSCFMSL